MTRMSKVLLISAAMLVLMFGITMGAQQVLVLLDNFEDALDANGNAFTLGSINRSNADTVIFATGAASFHWECDTTGPIRQPVIRSADGNPLNINASTVPSVGGYVFHWVYQDATAMSYTGFYGWQVALSSGGASLARYDIHEGGGPTRAAVTGWYQYWCSLQYPRPYGAGPLNRADVDQWEFQMWNPQGTGTFMLNLDTVELGTGPQVLTVDDFDDTYGPCQGAGTYNITGPATLSVETTTVQTGNATKITFPAGSSANNLDFGCWGTQFKFDLTQYNDSVNDRLRFWIYMDEASRTYPGYSNTQLRMWSEDWTNASYYDTSKPGSAGWTQVSLVPNAPTSITGTGCNYGNLSRWTMQIQTPNPSAQGSPWVVIFDKMEMLDGDWSVSIEDWGLY